MSGFKQLTILPPTALIYFAVSVTIIALSALALDRVILASFERSGGKLESQEWSDENTRLVTDMFVRNKATFECPFWSSAGWPVTVDRKKSKRILVMGDSFVWGHGYSNLNTLWWRQLEKELNARGYHNVEVIAAGLTGATTRDELTWAKKLVPVYRPDIIIWGYVTNDPDSALRWAKDPRKRTNVLCKRIETPEDPKPMQEAKQIISWLYPDLAERLFKLREHNLDYALSGPSRGYTYWDWELKLLEGENFDEYKRTISDLAQFALDCRIPMFAITLPNGYMINDGHTGASDGNFFDKIHSYFTVRYAPVETLFKQHGLAFFNTLDDFVAVIRSDRHLAADQNPLRLGINPVNGHPGPLACHFFAVEAADVLESKYPSCLGQKTAVEPGAPEQNASGSTISGFNIAGSNVARSNIARSNISGSGIAQQSIHEANINDWLPNNISLQSKGENKWQLSYPESRKALSFMPIRKPFLELNLADPIAVERIKLSGTGLKSADVYFSWEDPSRHFDDGSLLELGTKSGDSLTWDLSKSPHASTLNTILISARCNSADRRLVLEIGPRGEEK